MLTKRIIPCLDVDNGRVVKGKNFVDLVDAGDPVESAIRYEDQGADELVFLDITASSDQRDTIYKLVENCASKCMMPLTVGGGVRTVENIRSLLSAGADKVGINTASVHNPQLIHDGAVAFGSQCIVASIDAKRVKNFSEKNPKWEIYTHGGRENTGIDAVQWTEKLAELGAGEILLTSMDADGSKKGYDLVLLSEIAKKINIPVVASGGAGTLQHMADALTIGKADAVLAASIFHFGEYTVQDVKNFLKEKNIHVR